MKCEFCNDSRLFFSIMPSVSKTVAWCSHVLSEMDGKVGLYHYQCGNVDPLSVYAQLLELMDKTNSKQSK